MQAELLRQNFAEDKAKKTASKLVGVMAHYFGGKSFYLPAGDKIKEALRDAQIYQEFNGKNVPELIKNTDCQKAQFMRSYAINERFKESDIRWILILVRWSYEITQSISCIKFSDNFLSLICRRWVSKRKIRGI